MSPSGVWLLPTVWLCGWIALRWLGVRMTGGHSLGLLRWKRASQPTDHSAGDAGLVQAVVYSYGLRTLLAIALYVISLFGWPILTSLQFPSEPGFWVFGLDSHLYHNLGHHIAQAWTYGTELPLIELGVEYFALVAVIYRLLGSNPLYPILLNCWLGAVTGLLVFHVGRRLFPPRTARMGALLVTFWPSSLLWSAQLLKDALSWCLVFSAVGLVLRLAFEEPPRHRRGKILWVVQWIGLVVTVMLVTSLRFYLGSALSLAAVLILVPRGCLLLTRRLTGKSLGMLGVAAMVVLSTAVARTIDPLTVLSPRHPEIGHRRMAMSSWEQGDLHEAVREFERALELNPRDKESYMGLVGLHTQAGDFEKAMERYAHYLHHAAEPREQAMIRVAVARMHIEWADEMLKRGRAVEALTSYERALAFDGASLSPHAYLALMLIERGEFNLAVEMLKKIQLPNPSVADIQRLGMIQERLAAKRALRDEVARLEALRARLTEEQQQVLNIRHAVQEEQLETEARLRAEATRLAAEKLRTLKDMIQALDHRLQGLLATEQASDARELSWNVQQWEGAVGLAISALPLKLGRQPSSTVRGAPLGTLMQRLNQVKGAAGDTMSETSPEELAFRRQGFVTAGGHSLTDATAQISTPAGLLSYLPKALLNGFFAPFPWQWFDVKGSTGMMRMLAGMEMLAWYLLFPAILWGGWGIVRSRRADQLFLLVMVISLLIPMALVVANLGTLYRLRLLFLLPLLIIAAAGEPRRRYDALVRWIKTFRAGRMAGIGERTIAQPVMMPGNGSTVTGRRSGVASR